MGRGLVWKLILLLALGAGCGVDRHYVSDLVAESKPRCHASYDLNQPAEAIYGHLLRCTEDPAYSRYLSGRVELRWYPDTHPATIRVVRAGALGGTVSMLIEIVETEDVTHIEAYASDRNRDEVIAEWIAKL